jgi:uncharacterized protein YfaS (alpha-2-macroglobulin family)
VSIDLRGRRLILPRGQDKEGWIEPSSHEISWQRRAPRVNDDCRWEYEQAMVVRAGTSYTTLRHRDIDGGKAAFSEASLRHKASIHLWIPLIDVDRERAGMYVWSRWTRPSGPWTCRCAAEAGGLALDGQALSGFDQVEEPAELSGAHSAAEDQVMRGAATTALASRRAAGAFAGPAAALNRRRAPELQSREPRRPVHGPIRPPASFASRPRHEGRTMGATDADAKGALCRKISREATPRLPAGTARPAGRSGGAAALLLLALVLASCLIHEAKPSTTVPAAASAPRKHGLGLDGEAGSPGDAAPFAVIHAGPRSIVGGGHVQIVFNRPMRALGLASDADRGPEISLVEKGGKATLTGKPRWIGSHVLDLELPGVPPAREFVLTVPAGTRAADGTLLGSAFTAVLASERPAVIDVTPQPSSDEVGPSESFELVFNLPVAPAEVARAVSFRVGPAGREVPFPFSTEPAASTQPNAVSIVPKRKLPLASHVIVGLDASLRGSEGTLTAGAPRTLEFSTYGPLVLRGIDCVRSGEEPPAGAPDRRGCEPSPYKISVVLSNRVSARELFSHLRIDGTKLGLPADGSAVAAMVPLPAELEGGRTYTATLTAGLTDEHGQKLAADARVTFETAPGRTPASVKAATQYLRLAAADSPREVFEAGTGGDAARKTAIERARSVSFVAQGVPAFELLTVPLDESGVLAALAIVANPQRQSEIGTKSYDALKALPGAKSETRAIAPSPGEASLRVGLDPFVQAKSAHAAGVVAARCETKAGAVALATVVSVTDLAITAKMSRFGSLVWVSKISDGKAVAGATVSVRKRGPAPQKTWFSGKSDGAGVVTIPAEAFAFVTADGVPDDDLVLIARAGDDWTYRQAAREPELWSNAYVGNRDIAYQPWPLGVVLTDRGVYRAGETVHLKGILRRVGRQGLVVPKGERATVTVGGEHEKIVERAVVLDDFGAFALDVVLPESTIRSSKTVTAGLAGAAAGAVETDFLVADFKPSELKVTVAARAAEVTAVAEIPFSVRAEYLFGGPVRQGTVRYSATASATRFAPPGAQDLTFGPESWYRHDGSVEEPASGNGALDAAGAFEGKVLLKKPIELPLDVRIDAEVTDVTRQTVSQRARLRVHPAGVYVGLARSSALTAGKSSRVEALAFTTSGKPRPGTPVHLELRSVQGARLVACDFVSKEALSGCDLTPPWAGDHVLWASAKDPQDRTAVSSARVYVAAAAAAAADPEQWGDNLGLAADKELYAVGDIAKLKFTNPFPEAEMLLTIERDGVLRHERRTLHGRRQSIAVPITPEMAPNVSVAIHLHQGWQAGGPTHGEAIGDDPWETAPGYRAAAWELRVDPAPRRLALEIAAYPVQKDGTVAAAAQKFAPGAQVEAEITVRDQKGAPAAGQLTFWAVDEGVLALTGYEAPDVHEALTVTRPAAVLALESRDALGTPASGLLLGRGMVGYGSGHGSASGSLGPELRSDFRPTATFVGALAIGADGKARTRFKLPQTLTQVRLMAVAISADDRYGSDSTRITVTQPLVLRATVPRALRIGDRAEVGVVVTGKDLGATQVTVKVEAQGVRLAGERERTIALPAGGSVEVRWPTEATSEGQAKITFSASGGGESDAVAAAFPVKEAVLLEAVAVSGRTSVGASERLDDLSGLRPDVGGLSLRLGRGELLGLADGLEQLVDYPYGCTEQITSRLVPLLPLASLATRLHVALPADLPAAVDAAVARLLSHQRRDGSFGYWPDDATTRSPWLTAYALWGLSQAKTFGHSVPAGAVERAVASLARPASGAEDPFTRGPTLTERAFVLDVLASTGRADPEALKSLAAARASLPIFGRALLAHAMIAAKLDRAEARPLLDDVAARLRVLPADAAVVDEPVDAAYDHLLPSTGRTTAAVLRALIALDEKDPLVPRLSRGLTSLRRKSGGWGSTQEAAWALLALDDFGKTAAAASSGRFDASVTLGETPLFSAAFKDDNAFIETAVVPMAKLLSLGPGAKNLVFARAGEGALFYEARLRYARKELPALPLERGLVVEKIVRRVDAASLNEALGTPAGSSATRLKAGDLVLIEVLVATPEPREQVVVEDPLPGGLEAIDMSLATAPKDLDAALRRAEAPSLHREIRDDRVLTFIGKMAAGLHTYRYLARATSFGTYVMPPTRAECMYAPDVFGRTAASSITVGP